MTLCVFLRVGQFSAMTSCLPTGTHDVQDYEPMLRMNE